MTVLYHYTDSHAFLNIIQSKVLWATDTSFMNDSQEIEYAKKRTKAAIDQEDAPKFNREGILRWITHEPERRALCCFSEEPDLLSQWRAYADNGAGFAIGFEKDAFNSQSSGPIGGMVRVIYDDDEQNTLLARCIKSLNDQGESGAWSDFTPRQFWQLYVSFKSKAFDEEKEWRFVRSYKIMREDLRLKFRTTPFGIAPYLELPFDPQSVKEIYLGPKNPMRDKLDLLEAFASRNDFNLTQADFELSEATYQ